MYHSIIETEEMEVADMREINENTPKYVKIQNYILDAIRSGKYLPGSKLPT